jgi:hypothetical protein
MKIVYFRLKGYIKVLNGMGLDEIAIDMSNFKNRIVLIQGENGCAKSTIIDAMSPSVDSSDSYRTDVFIDENGNRQIIEYPAEKEIHYICNNPNGTQDYYKILIVSGVDGSRTKRLVTKAYISKNGQELNPNGNISSFKEIRDSMLGIDPIYLDLSSISSEHRGIVDMIPSDRRKYMAAYIGSLETYNEIFKIISKKANSLKSYMNTINAKLSELGNENELRLKLAQLNDQRKQLNTDRDKLIKDLAEAETTVRLIDPDNKMQDLYQSISDRLGTLVSNLRQIDAKLMQEYSKLKISPENQNIGYITGFKADTEKQLDFHRKSLDEKKTRISVLMALNESTANTINQDKNTYAGIESNMIQSNLASSIEDTNKHIEMYSGYISDDDMVILDNVSVPDLNELKKALDNFLNTLGVIQDAGGETEICTSIDLYSQYDHRSINRVQARLQEKRDGIAVRSVDVNNLSDQCKQMSEDLKEINEMAQTRPSGCTIDTCPYIAKYIAKKDKVSQAQIDDLIGKIAVLESQNNLDRIEIMSLEKQGNILQLLDEAMTQIKVCMGTIRKIKSLDNIFSTGRVYDLIKNHYAFTEFSIVGDLIEKLNIYVILRSLLDKKKSMEADYKVYQNNKAMIDKLNASIQENEKLYGERESELKELNKSCTFISGLIETLEAQIKIIDSIIELLQSKSQMDQDKISLKQEFDSVKDRIKTVKEKVDSLNSIKNSITVIEDNLGPINDTINRLNYSLGSIVDYQREYADSADRYEKISFIKNACNPGNGLGIQSEYIKRYMNDVIIDCNQMLGYMFNGSIRLEVPVINEKQFSIPFIGPNGIIVPDISNGSTAQKCMIGLVFSCVAMMKSSTTYNIPRFDEIDGGLDQQNRVMFINVLNSILNFMGSEQCIICSHNMEFDTQSTTRIICSHTGIRIEQ